MASNELLRYLKDEIVPINDRNGTAHDSRHVLKVMERSQSFAQQDGKDIDMASVGGAFHDIGYALDPESHGIASANILKRNAIIKENFSKRQVRHIAEAIEDHTIKSNFRSPYSEILYLADKRVVSVQEWLEQSFLHAHRKNPQWSTAEITNDIRNYALWKIKQYGIQPSRFIDFEQDNFMISLKTLCECPELITTSVMNLFAANQRKAEKDSSK